MIVIFKPLLLIDNFKIKKNMKKLFTLITAVALGSLTSNAQIYDNGTIVNNPGLGVGGADVSSLHDGLNSLGMNHASGLGYRVADDFIIPAGQTWTIDSIAFLAYQTNSGNASTITDVNCAIFNGSPAIGGSIVLGDTITNLMQSTYFSNIYRTADAAFTNTARPVMRNIVVPQSAWSLPAGTYWVAWQTGGTLTSGPWAPPLTNANMATGDAIQFNPDGSIWNPILDGGATADPQGLPFQIYGTVTTSINSIEVEDALTILPNPSKGNFMINASFAKRCNLEINVMDLQGRSIYSENVSDVSVLTKNVVLNDVTQGIYLLKLTSDSGKVLTKKIVVD